jgi:hypothetical protein
MARPSPEPRRVGRQQQAAGAPRLTQTSREERRRPVASILPRTQARKSATVPCNIGGLARRPLFMVRRIFIHRRQQGNAAAVVYRRRTIQDPCRLQLRHENNAPAAFAHLKDSLSSNRERSLDLSSRPLSRNTHARQQPSSWHCRLLPPY